MGWVGLGDGLIRLGTWNEERRVGLLCSHTQPWERIPGG